MRKLLRSKAFIFFVLSWVFLWAIGAYILFAWHPEPKCSELYRNDLSATAGGRRLRLQVAKNSAEQEAGLGGKKCIGPDEGMLFVFDKSGYYPFWMKGMKFPIDIVWLDANKNVTDVISNVSPISFPHSFVNSHPASYVLELEAGQAAKLGISSGTHVDLAPLPATFSR